MSLGARLAGVDVVMAVEKDIHAASTYRKNHPTAKLFEGDICDISTQTIVSIPKGTKPTVVFGGPPCQGFSYSNTRTRTVSNETNWLFEEYLRFVKAWRPDFVVFENVRGIIDTAGGIFFTSVTKQLRQLNYTLTSGVLNARDHGIPQDRARFFLVGTLHNKSFSLPKESGAPTPTVEDALADLPLLQNGSSKSWLPYGGQPPSRYAAELRQDSVQSPNHLVTRNADYIIQRYRHIPQGGNWENIPDSLMENYRDRTRCHTKIYHRLRLDSPSTVIGNYRKNMLIHPTQHRGLSVREAARIQSFPDCYEFTGSIGFQQQQVGNAVPPLLAKVVFSTLIKQAT